MPAGMNIDLGTVQTIAVMFAAILGGFMSLIAIMSWARRTFVRQVKDIVGEGIGQQSQQIAEIKGDLAEVHHEVTYNNGSSLKDMMREMLATQEGMRAVQQDVIARLTTIEGKQG